ncbi:MAG: 4-(cytidine 5'-diphospho)-2-C-methyl-D-erythritol kinase [Clostridiales bacterium]|nr:4-(cytidine 5'-diphospho)-2-C-methyl-D-erythritol kinase [Clostridiales bacterium]
MTTERAYAKLNLTLGVRCRRADGYHELDSLMQTVRFSDSLVVERSRNISVTVSGADLPPDNTVTRAARLYREVTGCGCRVHLEKRIPSEAGLGGGSADAAALLRALQRLHRMATDAELQKIALAVGADVPFCLRGGLCRCEGIGDILTPLRISRALWFVIAKPNAGVSTKALFEALPLPRPPVSSLRAVSALSWGDFAAAAPYMQNALESAAIALVPEIGYYKQRILEAGAIAAAMSGSGSAVWGLFSDEPSARAAAEKLSDLDWVVVSDSV